MDRIVTRTRLIIVTNHIIINQVTSRHNLDVNLEIVLDVHAQVLTVDQKGRSVVVVLPRNKPDRLLELPITRGRTRYGSCTQLNLYRQIHCAEAGKISRV